MLIQTEKDYLSMMMTIDQEWITSPTSIFAYSRRKPLMSLIAAAIVIGSTVLLPQDARAESGYRVCTVYGMLAKDPGRYVGMAVKVRKENNGNTCGKKLAWMNTQVKQVLKPITTSIDARDMVSCENFSWKFNLGNDVCKSRMTWVNDVYKFSSKSPHSGSIAWYHQ